MSETYSITYCGNYKIVSSGPKRLLRTQKIFDKESNHSNKKIISASFFRYYRKEQKPKNSLERWAKHFDSYCASYNVTSVGPQMSLETNISKKGQLHGEKRFWPTCSRIVEFYKPWGTSIRAHKVFWQVLCKW